ncbi:hypothetical protein [Streptomyces sp. NPDC005955]|uniref:hypothetical protein n=1 Tax=Streptomyces sp. NPDC005955 TaxID=3364738 RepID=UPI0036CB6A97
MRTVEAERARSAGRKASVPKGADGLGGVDGEPPADLCLKVFARLFPDVTVEEAPGGPCCG